MEPNQKQESLSLKDSRFQTLALFGGYAFGGLAMLGYFSYKGFTTRAGSQKVTRPAGERLKLEYLGARRGLTKALLASIVYFAGFGVLAWQMGLQEFVMQSMGKKDKQYMHGVKNDPFFRKIYILNTMYYFGISQRLIDKTKAHLESADDLQYQQPKQNQLWKAATVLIGQRQNVPTIHRRD